MADRDERLRRLAQGWDDAAEGYESYYVPRFAPWMEAAVQAITLGELPDGPIVVPCCGTFPELDILAEHFSDREIVGIDLSEGMISRARERADRYPRVTAICGDASTPGQQWPRTCSAVVSVFGLQQLPEPDVSLGSWAQTLRSGGRLSVVFWPDSVEVDGPWGLLGEVLRPYVPAAESSWERRLVTALAEYGVTVEQDEYVSYPMTHPNAETFFDAHIRSGPLRALFNKRGEKFFSQIREEFLQRAPDGEWAHHPRARHIVARR